MSEKINNSSEISPDERFRLDPKEFPLFSKQRDSDGGELSIDQIAEKYLQSTAEMIAVIDGSENEYGGGENYPKPDHIIYLDKSARPVSWMVNVFWPDLAIDDPDHPGQKATRPPHSYLNIDRVNWFRRTGTEIDVAGNGFRRDGTHGRLGFEDFDASKITKEDLAGIRALFIDGGVETTDVDEIMKTPTTLDGKNILIVDEVKNSGSTLSIAKLLIERAIPEVASTHGEYFWSAGGTKMVGNEIQMGSVPIWYDATTVYGRGIGDIDEAYHEKIYSEHPNKRTLARKMGAFAIGAPLGVDKKARQLMSEIKLMEQEFRDGHILFAPPRNYDFDRVDKVLNDQGFFPDATGRYSSYADFRDRRNKNKK